MKLNRIACLSLMAVLSLLSWAPAGATLITLNLEPDPINNPMFGRLKQGDTTACDGIDGTQACGPTAAVNSFVFLEKKYPTVYGGKLIVDDPITPTSALIDTANVLGGNDFMKCTVCGGGTAIRDFIQGKQDYIDLKVGAGKTIYKHQDVFGLGDIDRSKEYDSPSFAFLLTELRHPEDVEFLVSYHDATDFENDTGAFYGGHYLTITGLQLNDISNNGDFDAGELLTLSFIDPFTGAPGTANAFLNGFGFDTDYGAGGPITGATISAIVSESVPEPGTVVLLVAGLIMVAFREQRNDHRKKGMT